MDWLTTSPNGVPRIVVGTLGVHAFTALAGLETVGPGSVRCADRP